MYLKKKIIWIITILIISVNTYTLANETEEDLDTSEIESIYLEDVTTKLEEIPNINSRHAVVYDRQTGKILYGKKENEKCKMASTTKIMTSIVVLEKVQNLEEKVKVSPKSAGTGGSRLGLKTHDKIAINDLLYGLMLCSRKRCSCNTCRTCIRKCRRICKPNEPKSK